ncbi:MAG TPA: HtaA domain-containing protein [Ilumatobacter sp.]|nr:HtaA domain-containing protein [Ilumatobacter sp.]
MNLTDATRRRRLAGGLAATLVMIASSVVASGHTAHASDVVGGTISWGVKESFRNYIVGPIATGTVSAGGAATQQGGNGVFVFPVGGGSHEGTTTSATSSGSAHFVGHHGILEVNISDVRVSVAGGSGTIVADVTARPFTDTVTKNDIVTYDDVVLANLNLAGVTPAVTANSVTYTNVPAVLSPQGGPVFAPFYASGDALDTVTITLSLGSNGGGGGTTTTTTVAPPPPPPSVPAGQSDQVELVVVVPNDGGLAISISADQIAFGSLALSGDAGHLVAGAQLAGVTVTDNRLTDPGWNVTAHLTNFTGTAQTLSGNVVGWTPKVVESGANQTVQPGPQVAPGGAGIGGATLASATAGAGRGTAKLGADLQLQVPTDVTPGAYTAVLTLTVI